jgi:hypothetical protein
VAQVRPVHAHTLTLTPLGVNSSFQLAARQLMGAVDEARSNLLKAA